MKKFYILLIAMALTAGTAFAQSNDSIERAKQQEALIKQQQKEQQELLEQQRKEQEKLMKEQQKAAQKEQEERMKEQERIQKEQQKAAQKEQEERVKEQQKLQKEQQKEAEKAAKKEQDRIKREQTKAENKAKAEQKKAEKKRKRQEHYAAWNRHPNFTADPSVSILTDRRIFGKNNYYNSMGGNIGVTFDFHRPIAKRWDFNIGIGFRYSIYWYSHMGIIGDSITVKSYNVDEKTAKTGTIVLPIKLSHINKDNSHGWYIGAIPGVIINKTTPYDMNRFRLDVAIGTQSRWFIFSPGTEVYFNLLPTYKSGSGNMIHEFGIRFVL